MSRYGAAHGLLANRLNITTDHLKHLFAGDPENYNCECRVKAIIARENNVTVEEVGGRPWPATSTLSERWIDDEEKLELDKRMMG